MRVQVLTTVPRVELEKDLAEAVKEGKSTTPFPEKFRVMFEGIPCWPKLPNLFKPLKANGVNVTAVVLSLIHI